MKIDRLVEIHSKGTFIMPANAFLCLIFLPDLSILNLTAPASTVVGASSDQRHHQKRW